jgi:hypothetical protein
MYYESVALVKAGNISRAEGLAKNTLAAAEKVLRPGDSRLASPLILLGQIFQSTGKTTAAIECFERAYVCYSEEYGSVNMHVQEITFLLVNAFRGNVLHTNTVPLGWQYIGLFASAPTT